MGGECKKKRDISDVREAAEEERKQMRFHLLSEETEEQRERSY